MQEIDYQRLGHILQSIHLGVTIADSNGVFVFVSDSYFSGVGLTPEQIIGKHAADPEILEMFSPCVTKLVLESGERVTTVQKDLNSDETFVTGIPIRDSDGELMMIVCYSSWEVTSYSDLRERCRILEYQNQKLLKEIDRLVWRNEANSPLIAESKRAKDAERLIRIFCDAGCPCFIYGPEGCGKNFMASLIYGKSATLYTYDCGLLNEETIWRELLNDESIISDASGVQVIIVKNIDRLTPKLQRLFTDKCKTSGVVPVGISEHSLEELKSCGALTESFYHMFQAYQVQVYAVNERPEDIERYIEYYLGVFNKKYSRSVTITPRAIECLLGYEWKGNVDEIKHTIERIVLTAEGSKVDVYRLPDKITGGSASIFMQSASLKDMMEFYEKGLVVQAYEKYRTTVAVAEKLGISQATAVRKIQKYIGRESSKHE